MVSPSPHLNPCPNYSLSLIERPKEHMQNPGITSLIEPVKSKYYSREVRLVFGLLMWGFPFWLFPLGVLAQPRAALRTSENQFQKKTWLEQANCGWWNPMTLYNRFNMWQKWDQLLPTQYSYWQWCMQVTQFSLYTYTLTGTGKRHWNAFHCL